MSNNWGADSGEPPVFQVGDKVVAVTGIGGIIRPRVKQHTRGVIAAIAPWGELEVHFGEQIELVIPTHIVRVWDDG